MVNPAYRRGRALEYRVRDKLLDDGWWVIRAAGSKGQVDLIAYKENSPTLFIQVTLGKKSKREEMDLVDLADRFGCSPVIAEKGAAFRFLREESAVA